MTKVGVIGAMDVEVNYLCSIVENPNITEICGLRFHSGKIGKVAVVIAQSGVGKVNMAMCATIMVSQFHVTHLINSGIAGGMDESLRIFDIVVSSDVVHHDMDAVAFGYEPCRVPGLAVSAFPADKILIELVKKAYGAGGFNKKVVEGRVATGDCFVNSSEKKAIIKEKCNPFCVEMEGAALAQVAYLSKIPFVVIRCISDMAENTDEVYHEEEAAKVSKFVVEQVLKMME